MNRFVRYKKFLSIAGNILCAFGLVYVINRILENQGKIDWSLFDRKLIFWLVFFILVYCMANFLLASGWQKIMQYLGENVSIEMSIKIYGQSLLAKYIPGNIFQFAGRQALGVSNGYTNGPLARSIFWELGLLAATGFIFSTLALPLVISSVTPVIGLILFLFLFLILIAIIRAKFGMKVVFSSIAYIGFHIITSVIFLCIILVMYSQHSILDPWSIPGICGAYISAWLLGLLTPGAPGGMGVREFILLTLLKNSVNQTELLPIIIVSRLVTIGGDLFFYILSFLFIKVKQSQKPDGKVGID
jgi:uncharacterized membrane protein YbhN (UPF0104 family)